MTEKLLPCPFCGTTELTLTIDTHGWKIVQCDDCGMRGPCIDLEGDQYLDRWNARTPAPAARQASDNHEMGDALREMGEQDDPSREALRRMLHEFCDEHYHTCPADTDTGPCDCFAGHLIQASFAVLQGAPSHSAATTVEPVGYFIGNAEDGLHQVEDEFIGEPGVIPLYAAPTTSPEPDAVREQIARIVNPAIFEKFDAHSANGECAANGVPWAEILCREEMDEACEKADTILAALSRPAHGGSAPITGTDKLLARKIEDAWDIEPTPFNRADVAVRVVRDEMARKLDRLDVLARNDRGTSQRDTVETIPTGVYFNFAEDNFYTDVTGAGCGRAFYDKWKARWREFPASRESAQ